MRRGYRQILWVAVCVGGVGWGIHALPAGGAEPDSWVIGDCNRDGRLDLSDAIYTIEYLFYGKYDSVCLPLCDTDRSGDVTITEPIALLQHLFHGGFFPSSAPGPRELCDEIDNDCDGVVDEECVGSPFGVSVRLQWDAVTEDVSGNPVGSVSYRVYFGTEPGVFPYLRRVGDQTETLVSDLEPDTVYYFVVTAVDDTGVESDFSEAVAAVGS